MNPMASKLFYSLNRLKPYLLSRISLSVDMDKSLASSLATNPKRNAVNKSHRSNVMAEPVSLFHRARAVKASTCRRPGA
jgi:hypothetical protein